MSNNAKASRISESAYEAESTLVNLFESALDRVAPVGVSGDKGDSEPFFNEPTDLLK